MHFSVDDRTILLVRHGSHAYGLNVATSDEDFKGVCIKPQECYFGFTKHFDQYEHMGSKTDGVDTVVYSLEKFAKLAADCNPNIIEILHVADEDVLKCDVYGEILRAHRDDFLSRKARWTFAGYAHSQLKRIKTHQAWYQDPPKGPPSRSDFGLTETVKVSKSELGALDSLLGQEKEDVHVSEVDQAIALSLAAKDKLGIELPKDVVTLFTREKAYRAALTHWEQFKQWEQTRNKKRAALEAEYGYDTKHGMHLLRLMRMCCEIMETGKVFVKRHDREELLNVRYGRRSCDSLVEEAERLEARAAELYETSSLRREPDRAKLDEIVVSMTSQYLQQHG